MKEKRPVKNSFFLHLGVSISIAIMLHYLWWRAAHTLNPDAIVFSWILWAAEAFGVLNLILFTWMTWNIKPTRLYRPPKPGLKVDIFVPTYNEDLEILEATLTGCRLIAYPHTTYVLDDGQRPAVRELAERMGCKYITRPDNKHAKAGNLNHALAHSDGEFIAVLDADMVPKPEFLDRTLGYFEDKKLAFVQLPQEFYNTDSIQHDQKSSLWHEQSLFFRVIQPGKNHSNSAFWCGSPSVLRRKALEDVGGVATETITEDIHTSVRLHSRGWSSYFLCEPLAFGIAPHTVQAYLSQRLRWAQGTMQLYRSKESPLWIPGLTLSQRLSYFASFLAYVESLQKLAFILIPVGIMLFNVLPMRVGIGDFLLHWTPYFLLNVIANQVSGRGVFRYFKSEIYSFLRMVVFIQSYLVLFFRKPLKFNVTPKSVDSSTVARERRAVRIHLAIVGLILGSMLICLLKMYLYRSFFLPPWALFFVLLWSLYNALVILFGVLEVWRRQHHRKHYRFKVDFSGCIEGSALAHPLRAQVTNLSISGAQVICQTELPTATSELRLSFGTSRHPQIVLPIRKVIRQRRLLNGLYEIGLWFGELEGDARRKLFEVLFVDLPYADYRFDSASVWQRVQTDLKDFADYLSYPLRNGRS
ncbi:MAG: glycosyltransferase [Anaerolineales bacterium]|nr:glycosyltransferase [Anaerolineales bacterium]MCS7249158.1 glycosyltransferase [Anaerolineales bacterium]MDW8162971.1 glycosyltransferase [Anaerolineales bacterium]MDW8445882.1 glycosyltransferase [Anaerolineales bacterium]